MSEKAHGLEITHKYGTEVVSEDGLIVKVSRSRRLPKAGKLRNYPTFTDLDRELPLAVSTSLKPPSCFQTSQNSHQPPNMSADTQSTPTYSEGARWYHNCPIYLAQPLMHFARKYLDQIRRHVGPFTDPVAVSEDDPTLVSEEASGMLENGKVL